MKAGLGASASGKKGAINAVGWMPWSSSASSIGMPQTLPGTRTLHLSAQGGVKWQLQFNQYGGVDADGFAIDEAAYTLGTHKFAMRQELLEDRQHSRLRTAPDQRLRCHP